MDRVNNLKIGDLLTNITQKKKIIRIQNTPLTAAGENYGSLILAIKITFQNEEKEEQKLDIVAKLLPLNEFMKNFMNAPFTFRNELAFYQTILPTLRSSCGKDLNFFPKFFGGRLNLSQSEVINEDAVILLENLKQGGFVLLDRFLGFDLETAKLILSKMVELHASVIALKEKEPEVFEETLAPFFEEFKIFQMGEGQDFMASEVIVDAVLKIVEEDELCVSHLAKITEAIKISIENLKLPKNSHKFREDTFATLVHDDLWVNNIMVKTENGKIVDVKFIDWQLYHYASATKDILFFLCTSVQESVLRESFDDLISFYHENFIANLVGLNCDTSKFGFQVFQEEMKEAASQVTYFYMMTALPSIFASGDMVWEVTELNKERLLEQVQVSDICKSRIRSITRKFIQKGWL